MTNHESLIKIINSKHGVQVSELTVKLTQVTESHATTSRDMQRLLSSQRQMGEKWKDESVDIRARYEKIIEKTKQQMFQFQMRVTELETIIQKNSSQRRELIDQVTAEKKNVNQTCEKNNLLQKQVESLSSQISTLLAKEVELLDERKRLGKIYLFIVAREVDRLSLEKEHLKKEKPIHRVTRSFLDSAPGDGDKLTKQLEQDIERIQKRTAKNRKIAKPFNVDVDTSD